MKAKLVKQSIKHASEACITWRQIWLIEIDGKRVVLERIHQFSLTKPPFEEWKFGFYLQDMNITEIDVPEPVQRFVRDYFDGKEDGNFWVWRNYHEPKISEPSTQESKDEIKTS